MKINKAVEKAIPNKGQRILVEPWSGEAVVGIVVANNGEKNGERVVDYKMENGATHWCYLDQIRKIYLTEPEKVKAYYSTVLKRYVTIPED